MLTTLAKTEVLILDDRGLAQLTAEQRRDLLEILEYRHGVRSTLATSQVPIDKWHDLIGNPTLADAMLDRLVHNAYKINLKGASMPKHQAKSTGTTQPASLRSDGWQLCTGPGGSLHVERVAGFSGIRRRRRILLKLGLRRPVFSKWEMRHPE